MERAASGWRIGNRMASGADRSPVSSNSCIYKLIVDLSRIQRHHRPGVTLAAHASEHLVSAPRSIVPLPCLCANLRRPARDPAHPAASARAGRGNHAVPTRRAARDRCDDTLAYAAALAAPRVDRERVSDRSAEAPASPDARRSPAIGARPEGVEENTGPPPQAIGARAVGTDDGSARALDGRGAGWRAGSAGPLTPPKALTHSEVGARSIVQSVGTAGFDASGRISGRCQAQPGKRSGGAVGADAQPATP